MYFLTQVFLNTDGTVAGKGTSEYDKKDSALQAYHTSVASGINKGYAAIISIVYDEVGDELVHEYWRSENA